VSPVRADGAPAEEAKRPQVADVSARPVPEFGPRATVVDAPPVSDAVSAAARTTEPSPATLLMRQQPERLSQPERGSQEALAAPLRRPEPGRNGTPSPAELSPVLPMPPLSPAIPPQAARPSRPQPAPETPVRVVPPKPQVPAAGGTTENAAANARPNETVVAVLPRPPKPERQPSPPAAPPAASSAPRAIGLLCQPASETSLRAAGYEDAANAAVSVYSVSAGSAAERAGLRRNDILKKSATLLTQDGFVASCVIVPPASGRPATLEVWRNGQWQGITVRPD
jgi:hypothetical protein